MVTSSISSGPQTQTFYGLSSDDKPVDGVGNGSAFYEMDTGNVFMFDGGKKTWIIQ